MSVDQIREEIIALGSSLGVVLKAIDELRDTPAAPPAPRAWNPSEYPALEVFYRDEKADILIAKGDCRALSTMFLTSAAFALNLGRADGLVDAVIADPPYNLRKVTSGDIALEGRSAMKRDFGEWDQGWQPAPFLDAMKGFVRPGGSLISFTSDRLISEFRETDGLKPRATLVWIKANPATSPRPGYVQATEFIMWLQREGAPATWNADGYTLNTLRYPVCSGNERSEHPTQKPEKLLEELIERHTNKGDLILDPYMGSGTTLVAAKRLGRRAIGIELDSKYCDIAARRVFNAVCEQQDSLPFGA